MKNSQKKQIRAYLENGGKLTPMAALNFWGCFRLSARVFDINEDLFNEWITENPLRQVKSKRVKTSTGKYVSEYYLGLTDY